MRVPAKVTFVEGEIVSIEYADIDPEIIAKRLYDALWPEAERFINGGGSGADGREQA